MTGDQGSRPLKAGAAAGAPRAARPGVDMPDLARSSTSYRADIDGLRAIAVLVVMFYHAHLPGFGGGFLGVDIFFVISGFLITGIIAGEIANGSFSIIGFYDRRARRILPALFATLLLTAIGGWAMMLPGDLRVLGQSIVATVAFANNILLWKTSGYFDIVNDFKPLVHTWSLAVEEQYYLFIPLLMALLSGPRFRARALFAMGALSLASFAIAVIDAERAPVSDFLMLSSRLWEIGAGSLVSLALRERSAALPRAPLLSALGLAMILGSIALLGETLSAPNWATLIPVIGTCLLLGAHAPAGPVARLLGTPPLRAIGLISYSAYLLHQPLFAFIRLTSLAEPAPRVMAATIPLILAVAALFWWVIERPFRDRRRIGRRALVAMLASAAGALLALGFAFHLSDGALGRFGWVKQADPGSMPTAEKAYNEATYRYLEKGTAPDRRRPLLLVFGNSFARDFINMIDEQWGRGTFDIRLRSDQCDTESAALDRRLAMNATLVVFGSGAGLGPTTCYIEQARSMRQAGARHIVILGTKGFAFNNGPALAMLGAGKTPMVIPIDHVRAASIAARRVDWGADYADIYGRIADAQGRVPVLTPEGKIISTDGRHLTQAGARWLGPILLADRAFDPLRVALSRTNRSAVPPIR
ncbi:MAG: acyltransferase family protein [Sphingomicrobium sp.]